MDQIHGHWRRYSNLFARLKMGACNNVRLRCHPDDIPRAEAGNLKGLPNRESIEGDLWAWRQMPPHIWLWAWHVCGYISEERLNEVAASKWGMSFEEYKKAWRELKKAFKSIPEDFLEYCALECHFVSFSTWLMFMN